MKLPVVAIVGQPNTGKSSLFNRLINKRYAITAKEAGTTRDRIYHTVEGDGLDYILVDTGGISLDASHHTLDEDIKKQVDLAVQEADIILFTIDSKHEEISSSDYFIADNLRRAQTKKKKVIPVLTKCDHGEDLTGFHQIYEFGLGEPEQVSAAHKYGISQLGERIEAQLSQLGFKREEKAEDKDGQIPQIAVVGRPNVGKSSLVNAMLNEDKLVVSDMPGTTVDTTDSMITYEGQKFNFIDTAGMRRRGKIETGIEKFSVIRSMQAIYRSDVSLLLIDAEEGVSKQDQHIAGEIVDQRKGLIIIVNKWDLMEPGEEDRKRFMLELKRKFPFVPWAVPVFVSAKNKKGITKMFPYILEIIKERHKRISTGLLNGFLRKIMSAHLPSGTSNIIPKIYYISQVDVNPPHFVIFVNTKKAFHFSYYRYLENRIREEFGFNGTAIRIEFKEKKEDAPKKG